MPPQQQKSSILIDSRTVFNLLNFAADVHTACIRPFSRSGMGVRGLGAPGFYAAIAILGYAGYANAPDMIPYFWVWLAFAVYRRITADRTQHTDFQGWVWMFDWCIKDELDARLMEAAFMWIIGCILTRWSEPLGLFVRAGFFSFGARYIVTTLTIEQQKQAAHNARIEMYTMQRRFEEERRG